MASPQQLLSYLSSAPAAAAVAQASRMLVSLMVVKMVAVLVGPAGLGQLGNFMSVITMMTVFAGGGIVTGITKYVAEYKDRQRTALRMISAAMTYGLISSAFFMMVLTLGALPLAGFIFGERGYWWLMPLLGIGQLFCFIGSGTIAVVNGNRRSDLFALITVTGYAICVPCAFLLIYLFGFPGAAAALILIACSPALPALWVILRSKMRRLLRLRIQASDARALAKFSLMAVASATLFPLTEILIRTRVIESLGLTSAGYWQAIFRLSGAYIGFFTLFLATSYMPALAATKTREGLVGLVHTMLLRVALIFSAVAIGVYLGRDWFIELLFSKAFAPASELLPWQLLGDFFRVLSYVIGFAAVARASTRLYVLAEISQCMIYGGLAILVLRYDGTLTQVVQAYTLTYFAYFCLTLLALKRYRRET